MFLPDHEPDALVLSVHQSQATPTVVAPVVSKGMVIQLEYAVTLLLCHGPLEL